MIATRERPIIFSGEMVRAILDGRKTQMRRVVKGPPTTTDIRWVFDVETVPNGSYTGWIVECDAPLLLPLKCPYGKNCRFSKEWGVPAREEHQHVWCFPQVPVVKALFYRKDLFNEAGLPDRVPETMEELLEFAKKLTDPQQDRYGIGLNLGGILSWSTMSFLYSLDGRLVDKNEQGEEISLAQFRGSVVLLVFDLVWSLERARVASAVEHYHEGLAGKGVVVIGIVQGGSRDRLVRATEKKDLTCPVVFDRRESGGRDLFRLYGVDRSPYKYLIDAEGTIAVRGRGLRLEEISRAAERLLDTEAGED